MILRCLIAVFTLTACASGPTEPGARRTKLRDCPTGMVLVCESREDASKPGDPEIPAYEYCRCKDIM